MRCAEICVTTTHTNEKSRESLAVIASSDKSKANKP